MSIAAPNPESRAAALEYTDRLAKPRGSLGRLEQLAAWIAACQGECPPRPIENIRAVILAGDHGVTAHGVSAYPAEVTPIMVRAFVSGKAAISSLARQHGAHVRVFDLGVNADLGDLGPELSRYKIRRGSGAIHVEDALTLEETERAIDNGRTIAAAEIAEGADLLILGDMGIGNTTVAAALIASSLGLSAEQLTGIGSGLDESGRRAKAELIQTALARVEGTATDAVTRLAKLGSADFAAGVGFLAAAAEAGVPVLLDGVIALAEALLAEEYAPGAAAWFAAGHRSTEPAQTFALEKLGLSPILDLDMRLGEGTGAMAAVPLLRSAIATMREMALLEDLLAEPGTDA